MPGLEQLEPLPVAHPFSPCCLITGLRRVLSLHVCGGGGVSLSSL